MPRGSVVAKELSRWFPASGHGHVYSSLLYVSKQAFLPALRAISFRLLSMPSNIVQGRDEKDGAFLRFPPFRFSQKDCGLAC